MVVDGLIEAVNLPRNGELVGSGAIVVTTKVGAVEEGKTDGTRVGPADDMGCKVIANDGAYDNLNVGAIVGVAAGRPV